MKHSVRNRVLATVAAIALVAVVLVGVLLSGGGNGYEALKKALFKHIFETENVTVLTRAKFVVDGVDVYDLDVTYLKSGADFYKKTLDSDVGEVVENYNVGNVFYYNFDEEAKEYSKRNNYYSTDAAFSEDSDINRQLFDLAELFVNFAAGSAKNLIVNAGVKDGVTTYSINITESQFPEVAESVLNLADSIIKAEAGNEYNYGVEYENYDKSLRNYYKQKTGEEPDEIAFEYSYKNNELSEAYRALTTEMLNHYENMLASDPESVILYVPVSGEPEFYADYAAFCLSGNKSGDLIIDGVDLTIKGFNITGAKADAKIDSEGRLASVSAVVSVDIFDYADKTHAAEVSFNCDLTNYASTVVALPDLSDYVDRGTIEKASLKFEEKTYSVRFDGATYDITVTEAVE